MSRRRRAAVRRRRALGVAALAAAIVGAVVGAGSSDGDGPALPNLPVAQLAGERIITGFNGDHPPRRLRRMITSGAIAGVILFADNFDSVAGARRLARRLQALKRPRALRAPLLVMVDQEGGEVKRLPGPPTASAEGMGRRGKAFTRRQGGKTGRLLRDAGINVDLAPVLDVARRGSAIGAEHRSFGGDSEAVAVLGAAFAKGLRSHGVAATGKHFPGLGAAKENTDVAAARIKIPTRTLRAVDERAYDRFIVEGGPLVMVDTAIYPRLDDRPAALSRRIATGELRRRLGFQGVSISDSLEAASARAVGGPARLARLGARAGTDLLLYTSDRDAHLAGDALTRALRRGKLSRHDFRVSARRILALRSSLRG